MNRYKIVVAYDGTDFHGWQIQPYDVTIVSTLQKSFKTAFSKEVSIVGASRTDAGVHARGQVALCRTELSGVPLDAMLHAWNNSLPNSIVVRSIMEVDDDFHAEGGIIPLFADVVKKTYSYTLFLERPLPFVSRFGWFWKFIDSVDWKKFEEAMLCFVGTHDFRSFCKNEAGVDKETRRTIESIKILTERDVTPSVRIEITAKGFLRYQIRRMIGAALDVARKTDLGIDFIKLQLEKPSDQQEFTRAESCGLCLEEIVYKK